MRGPPRLKYGSSEDDELWAEAPWTTKENLRVRRHLAQSIKQPMRKNPGSQEPWVPIPILTPLQNYMNLTFCKISACVCVCSCFCHVQLFATLWTTAHQAPLSMGFSRQEYWNGLPYPPPGDLPDPGTEPVSLMSLALVDWVLYHLCHLGGPKFQ